MIGLDKEMIDHLDSVAQIVAGLIVDSETVEEVDENQKALLVLGRAYLTVYNLLLIEYMKYQEEQEEGEEKEDGVPESD